MDTAKLFTTGRSQAVRLPRKYRMSGEEVAINRIGELVILFPRDKAGEVMAKAWDYFTEDFLADRNQPAHAEERQGL